MARSSRLLWRMEKHPSTFLPLARSGHLGSATGKTHRRAGLRMAHDRCQSLQGSSPCGGGTRRQSRHESYKRGLNTKVHLAVDAHGMPLRVVVTEGTRADCTEAEGLIDGFAMTHLLADKGYDSDAIVDKVEAQGAKAVIPPRKNRRKSRGYDKALYKLRHLVENAFLHLKRWRGIATRYAKNLSSFVAAIQIRCLVLWLKIS